MKSKALLLVVFSGLTIQIACSEKKASKQETAGQPVPASILAVQYESVRSIMEAPGTVQPRDRISLSSQINGFVRETRFRVGDIVKKDQVLATLDARDAQSQKAAAQAAIDEAEAALSEARKAYQASVEMQAAAKASSELARPSCATKSCQNPVRYLRRNWMRFGQDGMPAAQSWLHVSPWWPPLKTALSRWKPKYLKPKRNQPVQT